MGRPAIDMLGRVSGCVKRLRIVFEAEITDEEAARLQKPGDELHLTFMHLNLIPADIDLNGHGQVTIEDVEKEIAA